MAWQSIETRPEHDRPVIVWNGYRMCVAWFGEYSDGSGGWHRQNLIGQPFGPRDIDPETHWMPLPDPPAS